MQGTTVAGLELPISQLALGTMTFGDTASEEVAADMLAAALDAGITVVDTANGYAGGASEEILAKILPARRDAVVLASKAGIPHPDAGDNSPLSAEGIRRSVDGSLRRLATDRLDLFYLHQPDRKAPLEETLDAVGQLIRDGKVGAWGVSNFAAWQISEVNTAADAAGMPRPVVAQQLYNLLATRIEDEYLEFAQHTGLLTMVYNPLGGGLLTGKHSFTESPAEGRFGTSRLAEMYKQRYWDPRLFDAVRQLADIADGAGLLLPELSFRWLLSKPGVGSILLGGSKLEQLQANIAAAAKGALAEDVVAACDAVAAEIRGPMPKYNR
ncbi:aryl-alcohol dehydrogenase-like predicted oxidoreductase [Pseudarthrobacter siccitolerans]|uniref:Aryl-alcohol dehydrogenase-like predicted oxidoreductase n=1 Tax=Pseudarthrobacter siccitolerans TaxID=861266 RepID=A0ABU0PQ70_9MICC|nr:aldo/keto reductase [Pseudarthrobacter siccitolerans]MDQ0676124.1 aryl-alcohol dehydrogenase-like predicted oxidoreductase [Pseudarthrobacter siccitolerans]